MDLTKLLADFTPGSYGIFAILILLMTHFGREWRLTRKLSLDDRLARRDGYAAQVTSLQTENRTLRREIAEQRAESSREIREIRDEFADYRKLCEKETDQLRRELRDAVDRMVGYERAASAEQIAVIRSLPSGSVPDAILDAANRTEGYHRIAQENAK